MKTKDRYWLDRIEAAAHNERVATKRTNELVAKAIETGVERAPIARVLGVHRSTMYRSRFNGKARP